MLFRSYHFGPALLSLPLVRYQELIAGSTESIWGITASNIGVPSRSALVVKAHRIEKQSKDGRESLLTLDGIPLRSWWQDQFGKIGRTIYHDGMPVDERLDLDGDGVFEARRHWWRDSLGVPYPAFIETDLDGDAIYEYREALVPPFTKSWDLDDDGLFDMNLQASPGKP